MLKNYKLFIFLSFALIVGSILAADDHFLTSKTKSSGGWSLEVPPTNFKEFVYGSLYKGAQVPSQTIISKIVSSVFSPVSSLSYLKRSIFLTLNNSVLTFEKLVQWNYRLSQSIAIYITGPADASSKTLRRALLTELDDEKLTGKSEDEYIFGVNVVVKQLQNIKASLEKAINVYKKYPFSMKILRPYSFAHLEEIIFMSEELVLLLEKFIQVAGEVKDLAQLTDKKDQLLNYAKHFTASIKDLAVMVDPSTTFDTQRKGLKLNIDNNSRSVTSGGNLSSAQAV